MADPQNEKSGLEHIAQAANAVKGAIKAGKALAGAAKGAAFGPYGLAAGAAWEGRKVIGKVIIVIVALLLLPVIILMMLPSMLFGGFGNTSEVKDDAVWDDAIVEEVLINDYTAVIEHYAEACAAVDTVMQNAHESVLTRIQADYAKYSVDDTMTLNDPYSMVLPHDSTRIICEYSALTDFEKAIKIDDLTDRLTVYIVSYCFF